MNNLKSSNLIQKLKPIDIGKFNIISNNKKEKKEKENS